MWKNEAKLETLQNLSAYIAVSCILVLKSVKKLNQIFSEIEYLVKVLECQIWWTITKSFFWERERNVWTLEKLSPYIGVFSLYWSFPQPNFTGHGTLVQGFIMAKLVDEYKTIFLQKWEKPWNFWKALSLY